MKHSWPSLEYSSIVRTATGCTQDINIQHRNTHTSLTRAPAAPRLTIQTGNTTSIIPPTQTYNLFHHSKAKKHPSSSLCHQICVFHLSTHFFAISFQCAVPCKKGALHHVCGIFYCQTPLTRCVFFVVLPFLSVSCCL